MPDADETYRRLVALESQQAEAIQRITASVGDMAAMVYDMRAAVGKWPAELERLRAEVRLEVREALQAKRDTDERTERDRQQYRSLLVRALTAAGVLVLLLLLLLGGAVAYLAWRVLGG